MDTSRHFTIGAVAKRADVGIDTIRYYERQGLLPAPQRRLSGYRDYAPDVVERLRFIRRAKDLGFTLADIQELLALSGDRERGVKGVKFRAEVRLAQVEARIKELHRVRRGLKQLIAACPGRGALEFCPILRALGGEDQP
jgi:MerR family copper efflux transcriptional regulator